MIIDCILDRRDDEKDIAAGYKYRRTPNGELEKISYNPRRFYWQVMQYVGVCGSAWAEQITRAMDGGTEEDVKRELCAYIDEGGYNPEIKDYINEREWL